MTVKKGQTVHYRRADDSFGAFNGTTLEQRIRSALTHSHDGETLAKHWKRRAWSVPPDNSETILMNLYHDDGISFFGDLTVYTKGFMQALLCDAPDASILAVEQRPPPQGREYIHSMMYWMVVGNHVLIIQNRSLTTKQLEQYLTWLLKEQTSELSSQSHVILNAQFDVSEVGGDLEDIREIVVGGTGVLDASLAKRSDQKRGSRLETEQLVDIETERSWGDRALGVLRAIMSNEADVQKLLQSIPSGADLDVSVHIGYKTKTRDVSRTPMQQALRNLPEGEITAIGKQGRQSGSDIRLSHPVRVQSNGSLLDPQDVRAKLKQAYDYFVESGKI